MSTAETAAKVNWSDTDYLRMQIARFTVGSRLYGMERPDSDLDVRVVFAYHPSALLGLDARQMTLTHRATFDDDVHGRTVGMLYQEIGHVVAEICSASLNAIEMLFGGSTDSGEAHTVQLFLGERRGFPAPMQLLIDAREHMLTRELVDMTMRYSQAQFAKWQRDVTQDKPLLHAMRTAYQAHEIMTTRTMQPRLPEAMVAQCRADVTAGRALDDTLAMHWYQQAKRERHFGKMTYGEMPHSVDRGRLNQILLSVREEAWRPRA